MENNKHLKMVDIYSLRKQLRTRLGDMRAHNWNSLQFSVDYITDIEVIVEYNVHQDTHSGSVTVFGRMPSIGAEIPNRTVRIDGNSTTDADALPDIALGLIVSNIYPVYLLVDSTDVSRVIYDDEHYPCPPIEKIDTIGK